MGSDRAEFHFPDLESAKNAWRFCVLQHVFFRQYEINGTGDQTDKNSPMMQRISTDVSRNLTFLKMCFLFANFVESIFIPYVLNFYLTIDYVIHYELSE